MESSEIKTIMEEYLDSLPEKEKKAYNIAKEQLGMSFDLKKSNGFLQYVKNRGTDT